MKKERIRLLIKGGIAVFILLMGYLFYSSFFESTDDAFLEAHVVPISPRVEGHVLKVLVSDNQIVKAGDALVELDSQDYQAKLDQAKATAQAAKAQALKAMNDVSRYEPLVLRDEISKQQFAHAKAEAESAQAQSDAAEAAAKQAELEFSYTKISSPIDGKITRKSVEPGSYVQVGQALMALVSKEVWVVANFKENQIKRMRPGEKVKIKIESLDETFKGHVDSIQSGSGARFSLFPPENATGNFVKIVQRVPVKIVFDELPKDPWLLGPGLSVVPKVKVK
jgi:membrane fusion protein (multidrug efflux system)